ncbi:hypothetical protein [Chryseobacterium scophthalmum]|uniref:Uncharacterized protein n=1 Tax=Chryseobacterium scophthalmum TaxID=59733 RepID=A0A1N6I1U2_9FLAO|nr:hypothetical protein [Chryseobacterium scophthalmum]SIO25919.1 hypothetical protein SAMN05421769_3097 [Chryseobacterium scophthalmum]
MKPFVCFFVLFVNLFCQSHSTEQINNDKEWSGNYSFSAKNRDDLKTSFNINIIKLDNITVKYISDDGKPEIYKNLKSNFVQKNKIKINFNPKYEEMGIIYIEKVENEYYISGSPIYFINPGNDEMPLRKVK